MGRPALMPIVLLVATIDDPAVLVRGVPDLGSKGASALAALDFAGENAHSAGTVMARCERELVTAQAGASYQKKQISTK